MYVCVYYYYLYYYYYYYYIYYIYYYYYYYYYYCYFYYYLFIYFIFFAIGCQTRHPVQTLLASERAEADRRAAQLVDDATATAAAERTRELATVNVAHELARLQWIEETQTTVAELNRAHGEALERLRDEHAMLVTAPKVANETDLLELRQANAQHTVRFPHDISILRLWFCRRFYVF
jgi:hypothetical protein